MILDLSKNNTRNFQATFFPFSRVTELLKIYFLLCLILEYTIKYFGYFGAIVNNFFTIQTNDNRKTYFGLSGSVFRSPISTQLPRLTFWYWGGLHSVMGYARLRPRASNLALRLRQGSKKLIEGAKQIQLFCGHLQHIYLKLRLTIYIC